jgi:hypothetical protein
MTVFRNHIFDPIVSQLNPLGLCTFTISIVHSNLRSLFKEHNKKLMRSLCCLCVSVSPLSPVQFSPLRQTDDGPRQLSSSWFRIPSWSMTIHFFLSRLFRVLKWGHLFDKRREFEYYWSLPLYWGVTLLALTLIHSFSLLSFYSDSSPVIIYM